MHPLDIYPKYRKTHNEAGMLLYRQNKTNRENVRASKDKSEQTFNFTYFTEMLKTGVVEEC